MLNSEHDAILDALVREQEPQNDVLSSDVDRNRLPEIVTTHRPLREKSDDSLRALLQANEPPFIFVRSGEPVYIAFDENRRPSIKIADPTCLRGFLDRCANYLRLNKNGDLVPVHPPMDMVNDMLSQGPDWWNLPPLEGFVESPILRPDGTILNRPGYDRPTRLYYIPDPSLCLPTIKTSPGLGDVHAALEIIDDVLAEFPFVDDASRASAFALLLTPVLRQAIPGQVPLALIDAPAAGTGKSLLTSVVALISTGLPAAMTAEPKDDEECRKSITALLSGGASIIVYDNVQHVLQSGVLALALTCPLWRDRLLGVSKTIAVAQRATWIATGNNIRLGGDLPRRCCWIRLDAKIPQPYKRQNFRHKDLLGWVREHRGELLAALLTIASAWWVTGKPAGPAPVLGSFEGWTRIMSGILHYAGIPGFLSNLNEMYEQADSATSQWEGWLEALLEKFGTDSFSTAELAAELAKNPSLCDLLPDELAVSTNPDELASVKFKARLGKTFSRKADVRFGDKGLHLSRAGSESKGGQIRWRVLAGLQGTQGAGASLQESNSPDSIAVLGEKTLPTLQPCVVEGREQSETTNPTRPESPCYACKETNYRPLPNGGWVCSVCHPSS